MSGFFKQSRQTSTGSTLTPNVGQYGWTLAESQSISQIIGYVNECKGYVVECASSANAARESAELSKTYSDLSKSWADESKIQYQNAVVEADRSERYANQSVDIYNAFLNVAANQRIIETFDLAVDQTVVTFTKIMADAAFISVNGQRIDSCYLVKDIDYTITKVSEITLKRRYPVGTKLSAVQDIKKDESVPGISESSSIWNRQFINALIGVNFGTYVTDGRTLTPRLIFEGSQYIPSYDATESVTLTGIPIKQSNGDLIVETSKGSRTFNRTNAEAISREDLSLTKVYTTYSSKEEAIQGDHLNAIRIKTSDTGFEYVKSEKEEPLGFKDVSGVFWSRVEDLNTTITRRVTSTMHYSAWTQDKAFVYEDCIYVPYMKGKTHDTTSTSIMMIKSYDGGCTWSIPELLIQNTNARGYYSMNAGVIRGRFVMMVGEWPVSGAAHTFYMYHKPLDRMESLSGILSSTAGSTTITVNVPKHGLFSGDVVFFSGVKSVSFPFSGKFTATVINENTFTVTTSKAATETGTGLGGASVKFSTLWDAQPFVREQAPKAVLGHAVDGTYPTHIHSTLTYNDNTLMLGFHHGGTAPREAGMIVIDNFFGSRVWNKRRLPSQYEGHQQEPSIAQDSKGRVHLLCRWSGQGSDQSSYAWTEDKGVTWNCSFFKGLPKVYGTDWPMVIKDDVMYCFGAQRRPGEDNPTDTKFYERGYTDMYLLGAKVSELVVNGGDAIKSKIISHAQYAGELSSSAVGVGSVVVFGDTIRYYYGSEDFCDAGLNADNSFANLDFYKNSGINADIWELQVNLSGVTSNVNAIDASGTKREEYIYKQDGRYINETPLSFEDASMKFQNGGQPVFQADGAAAGLKTMTITNNNGTLQVINRPDNSPLTGGVSLMRTIASGGKVIDWEMLGRRILMNIPSVSGRVSVSGTDVVTVRRQFGVTSVVRDNEGVFTVNFNELATAHYCVSVIPVTSSSVNLFAIESAHTASSITFRFVNDAGELTDPAGFSFAITIGGA